MEEKKKYPPNITLAKSKVVGGGNMSHLELAPLLSTIKWKFLNVQRHLLLFSFPLISHLNSLILTLNYNKKALTLR